MALRTIRVMGDEILTKQCRPVKEMTPRIKTLIEDMLETMYDAEGVGLARALQHEIDHLSGTLYVSKTENGIQDVEPIE